MAVLAFCFGWNKTVLFQFYFKCADSFNQPHRSLFTSADADEPLSRRGLPRENCLEVFWRRRQPAASACDTADTWTPGSQCTSCTSTRQWHDSRCNLHRTCVNTKGTLDAGTIPDRSCRRGTRHRSPAQDERQMCSSKEPWTLCRRMIHVGVDHPRRYTIYGHCITNQLDLLTHYITHSLCRLA